MRSLRLVLEYDGSDFHGWQRQPGLRTVEGVLRAALEAVTGEQPALTAAGRTDAGAHAHGQVVGLHLDTDWEPARLREALNATLPEDLAVRDAETARQGFHARRDALQRTYRYVVLPHRGRAPLVRRQAWAVRGELDVTAMRRAASVLAGRHDFAAFGRSPRPGGSTVRSVAQISVRQVALCVDDPELRAVVIEVSADAFLYGMMRSIAGALVSVGQGRLDAGDLREMLRAGRRGAGITVAPARGLHQWTVSYPEADLPRGDSSEAS